MVLVLCLNTFGQNEKSNFGQELLHTLQDHIQNAAVAMTKELKCRKKNLLSKRLLFCCLY
jgi:3-dehydroquinate dehydratase